MENYAADSAAEARSDRQRQRGAVGGNGNHRVGDADCVCERDEFAAGARGSAAAGVGGPRRAWREQVANGPRTFGGKPDAGIDGWSSRRWTGLRRRAFSCGDWASESAALERNFD